MTLLTRTLTVSSSRILARPRAMASDSHTERNQRDGFGVISPARAASRLPVNC
jgi:hypothetical protein